MHNYTCAAMATESPLCLGCSIDGIYGCSDVIYGCSDVIPQTCDRGYEKCLVVSVGQATITQTIPISRNSPFPASPKYVWNVY